MYLTKANSDVCGMHREEV